MTGSATKTAGTQGLARGFSMVEALVVVMIVLVIAAIAIPSMLQARIKANEGAAVASLHTIQTAETLYFNTYPEVGYAANLADLGSHGSNCDPPGKHNACIIMDETLTGGLRNGYMFEVLTDGKTPAMSYTVTATPASAGSSGRCSYVANQIGDIQATPATSSSGRFALGNTGCDQS
jgi:type IV pilus assembly protein PilA